MFTRAVVALVRGALRRRVVAGGVVGTLSVLALAGLRADRPVEADLSLRGGAERRILAEIERDFASVGGDALIVVESDGLLEAPSVAALRALAEAVEEHPAVADVVWLDDVPVPGDSGSRPSLRRLLPAPGAAEAEYADLLARVRSQPLAAGHLIAADGRTALMLLVLAQPAPAGAAATTRELGQLVHRHAVTTGVRATLTGAVPLQVEQSEALARDRGTFQILAYVLVVVLAAISFRGLAAVLVVAGAPALGVFWTQGMLGALGEPANVLTVVVLPVVLVTVGFTDSAHLVVRVRCGLADGLTRRDAVLRAVAELAVPCALTSLTTAVAFGSLMWADTAVIRGFGRSSAIGILVLFGAVITVVPWLCGGPLGARLAQGARAATRRPAAFARLAAWVVSRARPVGAASLVLFAAFAAFAATLDADYRWTEDLASGTEAYTAARRADAALGGLRPLHVAIDWPDEALPRAPGIYADWVEALAGEDRAGYASWAATLTTADRSRLESWLERMAGGVPQLTEVVAEVERVLASEPLLAPPLSLRQALRGLFGPGGEGSPFARYLPVLEPSLARRLFRPDLGRTLVETRVRDLGAARYEPVYRRVQRGLERIERDHPGYSLTLSGEILVEGREMRTIIADLAVNLLGAATLIFAAIGLAFRSFRVALVSVVPNLFPLVVTAALLAASGRGLQVASACAFTICLGVAVDDTIHLLARYRRERAAGHDPEEAVGRALVGVGRVLVVTTVVLLAGFATITASALPANRLFAASASVAVVAALAGDLIALPALLLLLRRRSAPLEHARRRLDPRASSGGEAGP